MPMKIRSHSNTAYEMYVVDLEEFECGMIGTFDLSKYWYIFSCNKLLIIAAAAVTNYEMPPMAGGNLNYFNLHFIQ